MYFDNKILYIVYIVFRCAIPTLGFMSISIYYYNKQSLLPYDAIYLFAIISFIRI